MEYTYDVALLSEEFHVNFDRDAQGQRKLVEFFIADAKINFSLIAAYRISVSVETV